MCFESRPFSFKRSHILLPRDACIRIQTMKGPLFMLFVYCSMNLLALLCRQVLRARPQNLLVNPKCTQVRRNTALLAVGATAPCSRAMHSTA